MLSMLFKFFLLITLFVHVWCLVVSRDDLLNYLYHVGACHIRGPNTGPRDHMNYALARWSANDVRVKELVGVVCGNFVHDGTERGNSIEKGCGLFERVTAIQLAILGGCPAMQKAGLKAITARYPKDPSAEEWISYSKVRDTIPMVCEKLDQGVSIPDFATKSIPAAMKGCDFVKFCANGFLASVQAAGLGLSAYKESYFIPGGPKLRVDYNQVSPMMPIVCQSPHDSAIENACEYFRELSHDYLNYVDFALKTQIKDRQWDPYQNILIHEHNFVFPISDAKPFIVYDCTKDEGTYRKWEAACMYLLTQRMELLMENHGEPEKLGE